MELGFDFLRSKQIINLVLTLPKRAQGSQSYKRSAV